MNSPPTDQTTCDHCEQPARVGANCPNCGAFVFDDDPLGEGFPSAPPIAPPPASEPSPPPGVAPPPEPVIPPRRPRPVGVDPKVALGRRLSKVANVAIVACAALWLAGAWFEGAGPTGADVHEALRSEPAQEPIERSPFVFEYKKHRYEVQPVATYRLAGLVVSHNDPSGFGDIYHDETSVDTRDLCVIWGANVVTGEYEAVHFESGSWTCYYRYGPGVQFFGQQLSNNHLITNDPAIREKIADVRIGDEVLLEGMLVNYRSPTLPMGWRNSSTTRSDTGNGACEVIFVERFEILSRATPVWYAASSFGLWALVLLVVARIGLYAHTTLHERPGSG